MKLSLAMIVKDEVGLVRNIISKYYKYFDEVDIAVDDKIDEFQALAKDFPNTNIFPYKWCDDFSDKRNFLQDRIKADYYLYLDTDDEIKDPSNIRDLAWKAFNEGISVVYCLYNYSKDEWGNCNAAHYKERIIKVDKNLIWNKPIHENILPKVTINHKVLVDDSHKLVIDHNIDDEHALRSSIRNIKILLEEYNRCKEKTDPRTLAYLGRVFLGVQDYEKAIFFLEKHIANSGWDEDRYFSWCQLSDIYRRKEDTEKSISCAFEALSERTDFPDAYLQLHEAYFDKMNWGKAIEWGQMAAARKPPKTFMLTDPSAYTWRLALSLSYCYFNTGDFEKAYSLLQYAKHDAPTLGFIIQNEKLYRMALDHKKYVEHLAWILNFTRDKDTKRIVSLLESVPDELKDNEVIIKLKHAHLPPKTWFDKSVVIFCGDTAESWFDLSGDKGIGGSEEAVIHMSRELCKLGYEVTVFNNCGENEGVFHNVEYKNWINFNPRDVYNVVISWRSNLFELGDINAKKKIVWVHDIPSIRLDNDTVKTFDKMVVLSKYHKDMVPNCVAEEKLYVSTNGINPSDFDGLDTVVREKNRIIYASSYNRGLEQLLEKWGVVRCEVPTAELHIYYGWDVYDQFVQKGWVKDTGFKQKMLDLMSQPGVFDHGRVSHKELARAYAEANVFAYSCTYAGEINCIALTKAIASGCNIITNKFAVMKERSPNAVDDKEFIPKLIETLGLPTEGMDKDYINSNSWESVARDWSKNLL